MLSNVLPISKITDRDRWDFASHSPKYYGMLKRITASEWKAINLGSLVDFKYGASVAPDYVEDGVLFIRAQNIRDYGFDLSDKRFLPSDLANLDKFSLTTRDVLVTRSGINVGDAAAIEEDLVGSIHGSYSIRLRVQDDSVISPKYLAIAINSKALKTQIFAAKGRSAQPNINITELSSLRIPLPPRLIQDRIAAVMQDAYAQRQEKLTAAEALLGGIEAYVLEQLGIDLSGIQGQRIVLKPISSIAGGRFDFEAVVATWNLNFNGIEATTLRKLGKRITERITPAADIPDEEVNYVSLGNIAPMTGTLAEFSPVKGSSVLSSSTKFKKGDILFGRMRPYLNKVWVAKFEGVCTNEAVVLRPNPKKVDTTFLHTLLLSQITLQQVVPLQSGTSLPRVSPSDILNVRLPIPDDLKLQKKFGQEIARRRTQAGQLRQEAETVVSEAKARVERMILGEETA